MKLIDWHGRKVEEYISTFDNVLRDVISAGDRVSHSLNPSEASPAAPSRMDVGVINRSVD